MRRFVMLSAAALAVVFALSYAVPAIGGPSAFSSASPVSLAKKALKKAKKADKRAKRADKKASQALAKLSKSGGFLAANVQTVSSAPVTIPAMGVSSATVSCPAGTVVISGGFSLVGAEVSVFFDHRAANGWSVGGDNSVGTTPAQVIAEAQCAATGNAVVVSRSDRAAAHSRDRQLIEQQIGKR